MYLKGHAPVEGDKRRAEPRPERGAHGTGADEGGLRGRSVCVSMCMFNRKYD